MVMRSTQSNTSGLWRIFSHTVLLMSRSLVGCESAFTNRSMRSMTSLVSCTGMLSRFTEQCMPKCNTSSDNSGSWPWWNTRS